MTLLPDKDRIAIRGLGYAGLPPTLATERAEAFNAPVVKPGLHRTSSTTSAETAKGIGDTQCGAHGLTAVITPEERRHNAAIVALGHRGFAELGTDAIRAYGKDGALVYGIKRIIGKSGSDLRL